VRDSSSVSGGGIGVGLHEARHWHRRAYGGQGELNMMSPTEIGHAAAYEAYRTWIHNSSMYEPLSGDNERQREGLIGLAVAEATRLLQFSGRSRDSYARTTASESAAHTASYIFFRVEKVWTTNIALGVGRIRTMILMLSMMHRPTQEPGRNHDTTIGHIHVTARIHTCLRPWVSPELHIATLVHILEDHQAITMGIWALMVLTVEEICLCQVIHHLGMGHLWVVCLIPLSHHIMACPWV